MEGGTDHNHLKRRRRADNDAEGAAGDDGGAPLNGGLNTMRSLIAVVLCLAVASVMARTRFPSKFKTVHPGNAPMLREPTDSEYYHGELPKHFDWRSQGKVGPVGDQGDCNGCFVFSATGNIESVNAVANGKLKLVSKQQVVDCCAHKCDMGHPDLSDLECCMGCDGGYTGTVLQYVNKVGIEPNVEYRYHASDGKCHFNSSEVSVTIDDEVMIPPFFPPYTADKAEKMMRFIMKNGAVSVSINANDYLTNDYSGGIIDQGPDECPNAITDLNHAVLAVGFGEENGKKYWIVKNSWGNSWGESGYFRMVRGKNICGIESYVTSAIVHPRN
ncbi:hypothetical protein L596_022891 [Steinernema carpocapsae]|uniref:Peptidase C1A papain C-terminal domain-containing protein n=1 Tax=Steinernema carpocapsae TaxID=34508 RepID=A0A4U5MC57_STECR|nr:hypothetical protein L596_022891 [Steinernema carpocapsae]